MLFMDCQRYSSPKFLFSSGPCYFVNVLTHQQIGNFNVQQNGNWNVLSCVIWQTIATFLTISVKMNPESFTSLEVATSYFVRSKNIFLKTFVFSLSHRTFYFKAFFVNPRSSGTFDSLLEISVAKGQIEITFWLLELLSPFWIAFEGTFLLRAWRQNR